MTLRNTEGGFTIIEAMIALLVLAGGLLALAQGFAVGLSGIATAASDITAREKATEAVESVYTARDTRTVTWEELRNASDGGVFDDGARPVRAAGPDGLVNTADDGDVEAIVLPGLDGQLGTGDDLSQRLGEFTRAIEISDVGPNLRRIRVTVRYVVGGGPREYTIETLMSAFA